MAVPKSIIPPINPPMDSIFSCPYMCSSSGGLREAVVVINSINIVKASSNAWVPSLKIARLLTVRPRMTSTRNTLVMAIAEIFRVFSL